MRKFLLATLFFSFASTPSIADDRIKLIATVTHPEVSEMSGIVASSHEGVYWVHNDSGDSARVFAIDEKGKVIQPPWIDEPVKEWPGHIIDAAWNGDWEDIALADGNLYIADVGNNGNIRQDMGIYVIREFNPRLVEKARTASFIPVRSGAGGVPRQTLALRL